MRFVQLPFVPPTNKPEDCRCGTLTGNGGPRKDIVCPACDGIYPGRFVEVDENTGLTGHPEAMVK